MKFTSLIFDFDGTIADTFDEGVKIYNQLAHEMDQRLIDEEEIAHLRHMNVTDFLDHLAIQKLLVPKLLYRGTQMLKSRIADLPSSPVWTRCCLMR